MGKQKILIFDMVEEDRARLVEIVSAVGLKTVEADSLASALAQCENGISFAFVEPVGEGLQLQSVVAEFDKRSIPFVCTSASSSRDDLLLALRAGCLDWVDKPVDAEKEKPSDSKDEKPADKKTTDGQPAEKASDDKTSDDEKKSSAAKEEAPPKEPKINSALEPYRALFTGQIPAIVEARKAPAIEQALKLFEKEFEVRTIIAGADDLARFSDLFEGYDAGVCAGPEIMITKDRVVTNLAQLLANENTPFGFQSKGTTGAGQLPTAIQYSISKGLGVHDGLQGLTASPARLLSNEMTFGSLARGKDADLVVLSGPPFENATEILAVMIDGEWVYDQKEQK